MERKIELVDSHFKLVNSFEELYSTDYKGKMNAIGWERNLIGNFEEIVQKLVLKEDITELSMKDLDNLILSEDGQKARAIIKADYQRLQEVGALPSLNLLHRYQRDTSFEFISTDVYSFHVDRSPIGTDTILCTYYGACSDIIPNEDVIQQIQRPLIREKLLELHDDPFNEFDEFLKENFFDMHYHVLKEENIYNLGNGNLWRLAVDHPDLGVPPCIHRAPIEGNKELRLLLIC